MKLPIRGPWLEPSSVSESALKTGQHGRPGPREVEAQAARGALTASMLGAWRIAVAAGLLGEAAAARLHALQRGLIGQTMDASSSPALIATLREMQAEYAASPFA